MEDIKLESIAQDTVQVEEAIQPTEPKEPTLQEKIDFMKSRIKHFEDTLRLTNELLDKEEGDEFVARDTLFRITKITKSNHMDIEMYKLEGTEDEPKAGQWIGKERVIKEKLAESIVNGNLVVGKHKKELERLEKELSEVVEIEKEDDLSE